jgi:hypothetical protein
MFHRKTSKTNIFMKKMHRNNHLIQNCSVFNKLRFSSPSHPLGNYNGTMDFNSEVTSPEA